MISCYNLKIKSANAASVNLWISRNVVTIFCRFKLENKCIIAVHRYKLKDAAATDRKLACSNRREVHQHNVQAFSTSASGLASGLRIVETKPIKSVKEIKNYKNLITLRLFSRSWYF